MQKLLTVAIPCFNSEEYLHTAVESLLVGGVRTELLIINDGSTDSTAAIADDYAARYPDVVRVVHQKNGGHGAAVMTGLREASGLYFKVVDSDDWVDGYALLKLLAVLEEMQTAPKPADLVMTNYIYDHGENGKQRVIRYSSFFPVDRLFSWQDVGRIKTGSYIQMHAATYRTALLRECEIVLPEHTFYEDVIYAYRPLEKVEYLYYLDVDLYHYLIGRPDQSVNESVMLSRIDQQVSVNRLLVRSVDLDRIKIPQQKEWMLAYIEIVTAATVSLLLRSKTRENEKAATDQLLYIRDHAPEAFNYLAGRNFFRHPVGMVWMFPNRLTYRLICIGYFIMRKIYGFN